ncbi:KH domain-containing protein [Candidatus Nomurabacteria bacterium]|uniref:RNA-binding protein KhpA n=1 Tax=Candidatus Dojkabacteria bacterium TaxID=2099670 RepID=A0A955KYB6_9BACT|nr:KH domain-containing protein [Candidatus Dojkabacteria bacterium]MCB9789872.1 KH domain-containing protein [Candidatus Nomurabacteria bacterium]MCB9803504.1 KH domain-containing protein [Candidatus Nomurabacteria bacterium]
MKQLLETIVRGIVNNPNEVSVEERESVDFPGLTILEITVSDSDKGILIGRKGRTINAIRDLMTISAIRNDKKIKVLVKDDRDAPPVAVSKEPESKTTEDSEPNYNIIDENTSNTDGQGTEDILRDEF